MSQVMFGRRAKLVISSRQKVGKLATAAAVTLFEIEGGRSDTGATEGLRFSFQYKKSWLYTPNNGSVTVYNLSKENRRLLTKEQYVKAAVFAGYGSDLKQAFVMDIRQANSAMDGQLDWATKLEGGDGSAAWTHAHANVSFGKNSKVIDAAMGLVDKVAKPITGVSIAALQKATAGKTFKHGYAANGNAAEELRNLCRQAGLEFSIQDDQIQISEAEKAVGTEIFEWGPRSGLIGSPEYASPPAPGKPQLIKAKGLLNPVLKVSAKLALLSEEHAGEYLIRELTHTGDTHGGDWYTEAHGLALRGAT